MYTFSVVLVLVGILQTDGQLYLSVDPGTIEADLSRSLVVNCSFYSQPGSNDKVVSLIIKKETSSGNSSLTELAYINTYTNGMAHLVGNISATSQGKINILSVSYLSIEWDYPSFMESGNYICEGNIMNDIGDMHINKVQASVATGTPEIRQIAQRIQEIENNLKNMRNDIATLNTLQSTLQQDVNVLELVKDDWKKALFDRSNLYSFSIRYYLSRYQPQDARNAELACEAIGGYLADVNDESEYGFIVDFVKGSEFSDRFVVLDGTNQYNGTWVNRHNGMPLTYTDWELGIGIGASGNYTEFQGENLCQSIYLHYSHPVNMQKISCDFSSRVFFLCEVKEYI